MENTEALDIDNYGCFHIVGQQPKGTSRQRLWLRGAKRCSLSLDLAKIPGGGGKVNKLWTPTSSLSPGPHWCLSVPKFNIKPYESGSWGAVDESVGSTMIQETNRGCAAWPSTPALGLGRQQFSVCLLCSNFTFEEPGKQDVASWKESAHGLKWSSRQIHGQALR